jgi:hypothetical protein
MHPTGSRSTLSVSCYSTNSLPPAAAQTGCELAREQADSLREQIEEAAHRRDHSAPRRENSVHDSDVNLERWQQSDQRAVLQVVGNEEMRD